jgi:hypothetical protein
VAALALRTGKAQLFEGLRGVVFVRIGLELWPDESLHFLGGRMGTLGVRHLTVFSLGAGSSVSIYYIKIIKEN